MRPPGVRRMLATDEEILTLRGEGLLWREVGARVGMSTPGVHGRWRELRDAGHADPMPAGAAKRPRPRAPKPDPALELYLTGLTLQQVGDRLGCSRSTVARRLEAAGVPARKRGVRHPADDTEILRLRSTGLTWREVAARWA